VVICKPGVHALLIYALAAATLLGRVYAQNPRTLEDWGSTPMSAKLCPDPSDHSGNILLLEVRNDSASPIRVTRIALLQVGRASEHWTIACQPLSDALHGDWALAPREKRQWKFDLRNTTFESDEGLGSGPADEFVRKIPEDDREFTITVLHKSSTWPQGFDQVVSYRPGKSLCSETTPVKEGHK
jgi:hypothetical protein